MSRPDNQGDYQLRPTDERHATPSFDLNAPIATPLELHRGEVQPAWVDYNRHMTESCYLLVFGDSADAFFRFFGVDDDYRARGHSIYTAETHLRHRHEAKLGEPLRLTLRLLDFDNKRLHVFHEMYQADNGVLLASAEQMLIHVDMRAGRASPFPTEVLQRLAVIHTAHARAAVPPDVGRKIASPRHSAPPSSP